MAGDVIAKMEGVTPGPKAYSSVQVGKDKHIEVWIEIDLVSNYSSIPIYST